MFQVFQRKLLIALICAATSVSLPVGAIASSQRDRALEILNNWTSIRWGEENLAWVVYYPESLIDPWVNAEVERQRMRPDQASAFKASFVEELRLGAATPILLSVQVLGSKPLNISPLADNVALIDSTGRRIRPMVIEKALDAPLQGMAQGLIFFPKQNNENFAIAVRGLIPERETIFEFNGATHGSSSIATETTGSTSSFTVEPAIDEVVVKIPTPEKPKQPTVETPNAPDENEVGMEGEIFEPTRPAIPEQKQQQDEPPPFIFDDTQQQNVEQAQAPSVSTVKMTPRQALDTFLKLWIEGDTGSMYGMLSNESRERMSKELFDREVRSGSFRNLLRAGYKTTWTSDHSAKITVSRKFLLMRSLESKIINFIEEDGTSRVSW